MQTSANAIGEAVSSTRGGNNQGPLDIAIAVENKGNQNPSKIIVMGNASFISDSSQTAYGSMYTNDMIFFLQSISWMMDKQDDLVVPAKTYDNPTINITQLQASAVSLVLLIILPLIILGTGMFVFLRRRHL
jgi:ABC-type uncharacterized transport system involved in gliding motility auxiliary subunit